MNHDELAYNALVLTVANLQRLMVFHNSTAMIEGVAADTEMTSRLAGYLDTLGDVVRRSDESRSVSPDDVDAVRPIGEFLTREVRTYYETDLDGPLRTQAAFGAGSVFAAAYLNQGTIRMGEVFDHPQWSDRARQHVPTLNALRSQAESAVASAAQGVPSEEAAECIRHHVAVASGDRTLALSQVDAIPQMLAGRDPLG